MNTLRVVGQTISNYKVLELLGQGGMGVVYRAEDLRLGRTVALKTLPPACAHDPVRRKRFEQEARAAAALMHANVAAVYGIEEHQGELLLVFEYVAGETLRSILRRSLVDVETATALAIDIAKGLAAAHGHGVVHRDLKPENVMRTPDGAAKILDFGLARFEHSITAGPETQSVALTEAGATVGTVAYMSPEQLEGREADFRSDIFAFGVVLYELVTRLHPFDAPTSASTVVRILTSDPVPAIERNPLAPAELDRIIRKCLRKKREERYQSTRDLVVDLENLKRDSGEQPATALAEAEDELSLFRSLRSFVPTRRRWWELNLLFAIAVYLAIPWLAWQVRKVSTEWWAPYVFTAMLVCVAVPLSLRVILFETAAWAPRELSDRVGRFAPAIRLFTASHAVLVLLMARLLGVDRHPVAAPALVAIAVAVLPYGFILEPMIERAAFPALDRKRDLTGAQEKASTRRYRAVAAIQAIYVLPLTWGVWMSAKVASDIILGVDQVFSTVWRQHTELQVGFFVSAGFAMAGYVITSYMGVEIWRGNREVLHRFVRFFPVFLLFDILAMLVSVGLLLGEGLLSVGLLLLPILAYLPFYQRHLARSVLCTLKPPEDAPAAAQR